MSKDLVTIFDVPKHVGQEVTIGAWVANKSGKGKLAFLQLRDGTAFFQAVAFKPNFIEKFGEEEGAAKFDTIKRLSQETSVSVTGIVKEDQRSKFGYELDITDLEVIGESVDYPITPKEHGTDFLMDNRHLWLRSRKQVAIQQVRNANAERERALMDKRKRKIHLARLVVGVFLQGDVRALRHLFPREPGDFTHLANAVGDFEQLAVEFDCFHSPS